MNRAMRPWVATLLLGVGAPGGWAAPVADLPWSFKPLAGQPVPETRDADWSRTRTDSFILSRIEEKGLKPAAPADDRVLLRRLSFNLTGLPPGPEQVAAFREAAAVDRELAIAREVDKLLASPHYGERWARHWLDLARYTDKTASWLKSTASSWLYRDWVVEALNRDLPYDEFIKLQLANDLIPGADPKDNAALGFLGLSPTYWKELKLPPEIIRTTVADEWEERMDAVGRTFLGLTFGCARCHDHKFEPVTQADYYAIAGVFASVRLADRPTIDEEFWAPVAEARAEVARLEERVAELNKKEKRTEAAEIGKQISSIKESTPHYHVPTVNGVAEAALFVNPAREFGTTLDYKQGHARDLAIHRGGDPNVPGEVVPRRFLGAFPFRDGAPRRFERGSGRLDLAEAIVEEAAPLAARVIVNRVWHHHFGRGIVSTPSELGHSGDPPTHPALLDDLTARFVKNGWSLKWLHREILLSATWQQGIHNPAARQSDPANESLARMNRRRLEAETWRDSMLAASGQLDAAIGGAPRDLADRENRRRTLYGLIHRREPNQFLRLHDFPDPTAHAPTRPQTITPLQQLFTLNGSFIQWQAEALAASLMKENGTEARVVSAYRRLFQRLPRAAELSLATAFLAGNEDSLAAWSQYAHALFASNEFQFIE
ncbi:MAG: DUF1553 domain-containing protein [Akkermansiaceae bacterium]|nr:DUF1553 domain-containing protein [Akkermansiaceae bacterium]